MMHECETCHAKIEDAHIDDSGVYCQQCVRRHGIEGALAAGIPMNVVLGKAPLSDYFSAEYIESQLPRGAE